MGRPLLALCFAVSAFALWLSCPVVAAAATAGDPGAAVSAGTDPDAWFNSVKQSNWDVTGNVSGGMTQILTQALLDLDSYKPTSPCKAAAFNQAWGALSDAANGGPLEGFIHAIKDSLTGIQKVATFGADPEAAAEAIEAGKAAEQAFEEAKDKGTDWLKEKLKQIWKGKPVEVLERTSHKGGCDIILVAIWDEAAQTYEITIYGACHCKVVPDGTGRSSVVKTFAVQLKGTVVPGIDDGARVLNIGFPKITVDANCDCGTGTPGTIKTPSPSVTPGGGTTTIPHGEGWSKVTTTCPKCQPIVDAIHAAQEARDGMDREFRAAQDELQAAQSSHDQARIAAATAAMNALTAREAALIKLEQQLWEKLKECEANCNNAPTPQRTESPKTPVTPTTPQPGNGQGAGEGAYVPHASSPNGYIVGTVVDPQTNGATDFIVATVDAQGHKSFFRSVTDDAKRFVLFVGAGTKLVEIAKHFGKDGDLDNPSVCSVGTDLPVPGTRDLPTTPPANGPAIVGGDSSYERGSPVELHARGIDPRNVQIQFDGSSNGTRVLAASDNDVVASVKPSATGSTSSGGVAPGLHTATLVSDGKTTNSMRTVLIDVTASLAGSEKVGGTKVATLQIVGIPDGYPATCDFTVDGASTFESGGLSMHETVKNGTVIVKLKNMRPGQMYLHYAVNVSIPGYWE